MAVTATMQIVAQDVDSWTMKFSTTDGIDFVDLEYVEKLPFGHKVREMATGCPQEFVVKVLKRRRYLGSSYPFHHFYIVACPTQPGGDSTVTGYWPDGNGGFQEPRAHQRSPENQELLDYAWLKSMQDDFQRVLWKVLLLLLVLLLLTLWWWLWWRAFGPFVPR